jgi:hypothetical protein
MSVTRQEMASTRHAPMSVRLPHIEAHTSKRLDAEENQDLQGSRMFPQEPTRALILIQ